MPRRNLVPDEFLIWLTLELPASASCLHGVHSVMSPAHRRYLYEPRKQEAFERRSAASRAAFSVVLLAASSSDGSRPPPPPPRPPELRRLEPAIDL